MQNWFSIYTLTQDHKSWPLLQAVIKFLTVNFEKVIEHQGFLQLDFNSIVALLSSNDLAVTNELKAYQAVRLWVNYLPSQRYLHIGELIRHVRFPLLTRTEQVEISKDLEKSRDLHLIWKNLDSQERLQEVEALRLGMCKPYIMCVDYRMCKNRGRGCKNAYMSACDPQTESWKKYPGLQSLRYARCTAGGNKIYISGGFGKNSYSSAVYEYDSFKCQWTELPSMSTPRCMHGFLYCNQKLFAVGGWNRILRFLDSAESFDLKMKKWTEIARLPFAVSHPASTVFRGKLYFLGGATGFSGNWKFHRGLLIYDTHTDAWTQVPLSTGFFAAGAIAVDEGIYIIGGFTKKPLDSDDGLEVSRECFFLNEAGSINCNVKIPKLPIGLPNAGVVGCHNRIYILGGEDLKPLYKTIYHWEAGETCWHQSATDMPISQGISRFGCAVLMNPKRHIRLMFQEPSCTIVAGVCNLEIPDNLEISQDK